MVILWKVEMLKNFNRLINSIIFESVEDKDEKRIREVYNCNEFYHRYLETLMDKINLENENSSNLVVTKQRQNVFLITGFLKDVSKFFKELKVDEAFLEKPEEFKIYSPQWIVLDTAEDIYIMGRNEMWPRQDFNVPSTHDIDNSKNVRSTIFGKWFSFYKDDGKGLKIKGVKPSDLIKNFNKLKKESSINDETIISVEFSVNCEQWANQIFDEMSEDSDIEWRDDVNRNDEDFDYSLASLPKHSKDAENEAKKSLKDVKRTIKKYK